MIVTHQRVVFGLHGLDRLAYAQLEGLELVAGDVLAGNDRPSFSLCSETPQREERVTNDMPGALTVCHYAVTAVPAFSACHFGFESVAPLARRSDLYFSAWF